MPITTRTGYAGRTFVNTGSKVEESANYSRAIRDGDWVFISNTSGFHYDEDRIDDDVALQAEQMVQNVRDALFAAGATPQDVVRAMVFCPNPADFPKAMPALLKFFDGVRPTMTAICSPLGGPELKIEMEVTAKVGSAPG